MFTCDNCGKTWPADKCIPLGECPDLGARLEPGARVPAGDCPECFTFVYPSPIPLRVLVTERGGIVYVDHVPPGVTVEVRSFDKDSSDEPALAYEVDHTSTETSVELARDPNDRDIWRRADNARPEFDGEAPHANDCPTRHHGAAPCECRPALGLCAACGLRDATPGRDDGMCSECFAAQASE